MPKYRYQPNRGHMESTGWMNRVPEGAWASVPAEMPTSSSLTSCSWHLSVRPAPPPCGVSAVDGRKAARTPLGSFMDCPRPTVSGQGVWSGHLRSKSWMILACSVILKSHMLSLKSVLLFFKWEQEFLLTLWGVESCELKSEKCHKWKNDAGELEKKSFLVTQNDFLIFKVFSKYL